MQSGVNALCLSLQAMSEEQLKAFLEAIKADPGLQEQLKAAGDVDAVVKIAKEAGFAISAEELQRAQAEISEGELEGVVGGGCQLLLQSIGKNIEKQIEEYPITYNVCGWLENFNPK
jgi:predicted ribosomally synthesized peptide with nif11-like leader